MSGLRHKPNILIQLKTKIAQSTENCHCNPKLDVPVKCDDLRAVLGAAGEENTEDGWKPIACASQFFNPAEEKYSVNELVLLGVVCSIDHFKYYLYGGDFTVIRDHRALLSIVKEHRSKNPTIVDSLDGLIDYFHTMNIL